MEQPVKVKHITVTITIPPPEDQEEKDITEPVEPVEPARKKLVPLGSGRARPRKAKRMKITEPNLESIDEDIDEVSSHTQDIEEGYTDLLNDVNHSHELMLKQKRRTVALLRQTNYAHRSHQESRQVAMTSLAKRKLKRLPAIPTGRPALKYTNGDSPGRSCYDDIANSISRDM